MKLLMSAVFFFMCNGLFLFLFKHGFFTPMQFITAFAVVFFLSFIIYFISEIQEFSFAGNIVKLREVKKGAEEAIKELQASRIAMFAFLLDISKKYDGGFASISPKDERLDNFFYLHGKILEAKLSNELRQEVNDCVDYYMKAQLHALGNYSKIDRQESYTPDELILEALKDERVITRNGVDVESSRRDIVEAISYYRELYNIKEGK